MPKFREVLFGKKAKMKKESVTNPMQEDLMALIAEGLKSGTGPFAEMFGGKEFDKDAFDKGVTEPALKNFQEKILPMLQEKFIGGGQLGGSGQEKYFSQAGTDLQSQLANLLYQAQQQHGQQNDQNKMFGIQNILGTKTFENIYKPGSKGLFGGLAEGVAGVAGNAMVG